MAAYDADRLSLNNLSFRIYACACPISQGIPDDLGEVPHELVGTVESIGLDPGHLSVVADPDQEVAPRRVEERRDRFEHGVCDDLVILPILAQVPAERRFKLQCFGLALLDQLLGTAVGPQIMIE